MMELNQNTNNTSEKANFFFVFLGDGGETHTIHDEITSENRKFSVAEGVLQFEVRTRDLGQLFVCSLWKMNKGNDDPR